MEDNVAKQRWKNHYDRRDSNLRSLGFSSYREYLMSDLWRQVKIKAFQKHGNKCIGCGGMAQTFHHTRYFQSVLKGENLGYLKPICHDCHREIEFHERTGKKMKITYANKILIRKRKAKNRE